MNFEQLVNLTSPCFDRLGVDHVLDDGRDFSAIFDTPTMIYPTDGGAAQLSEPQSTVRDDIIDSLQIKKGTAVTIRSIRYIAKISPRPDGTGWSLITWTEKPA